MAKPQLAEPFNTLEDQLIQTAKASLLGLGHQPESYSDWQLVARALMQRFDIGQRPLDITLPLHRFEMTRDQIQKVLPPQETK